MPGIEGRGYGKPRTKYPDFSQTPSGLQYKDVREGKGNSPTVGDRVVMDWEGYTIGYYGRPFEAKGKTKGGAFDSADKEYLRFVLGKTPMIPALEEALQTMKPGGIRQVIVPAELGYPVNDPGHDRVGPKPSTFSGQRALDFVLTNQGLVDKTVREGEREGGREGGARCTPPSKMSRRVLLGLGRDGSVNL
ncbi:Peptidyl-prolyl cis-trans isomerase, FKBP-type [Nannochloropsis gaditana]|uniref:peptidylprolyl isomerase n=1 Tax=Nannochloropsis gaditana TaxID=72520 RepID=W7TP64_9STRA|nr:Peptidyl-prolyl cis-trans isomerase, FKBP-type [Nannochloropsis gaditana]